MFINKDVDLYITGSNAYLLSSKLATLLTILDYVDALTDSYLIFKANRYDIKGKE